MATITIIELAAALRTGDGVNAPEEPLLGLLERLRATAISLINRRCSHVPDHVRNEAITLLSGYWFDKPIASEGSRFSHAWHFSGAGSILAPWRTLKTGIDRESESGAEPDPEPVQVAAARLAWSDAPVATEQELINGVRAEFAAGEDRVILTMPQRPTVGYAQLWVAPLEISVSNWWLNGNPQGTQSLRMPYDLEVDGTLGRAWASASELSPLLSGLTIWIDKS